MSGDILDTNTVAKLIAMNSACSTAYSVVNLWSIRVLFIIAAAPVPVAHLEASQ